MTTLHTQYLRVYSDLLDKPAKNDDKTARTNNTAKDKPVDKIRDTVKPYGGLCITIDTETTTGIPQELKFGYFEIHGLLWSETINLYDKGMLRPQNADTLRACGIFYDSKHLVQSEIDAMEQYVNHATPDMVAQLEGVEFQELAPLWTNKSVGKLHFDRTLVLERDTFIDLFYKLQIIDQLVVIGHNLPFDLAILAHSWGKAIDQTKRKSEKRQYTPSQYKNGFSLKLCSCRYVSRQTGKLLRSCLNHPNIRLKRVGFAKTFIQRGASKKRDYNDGKPGIKFKNCHFLDTMTLADSLLGVSHGLASLSKTLLKDKPELQKMDRTENILQGTRLTYDDVSYGCQDVHTTWSCYRELKRLYLQHDTPNAMWYLYSSASIGKAHLKTFGIKPFLENNPDFPKNVLGISMLAYYGARNEIAVRLQPTEVLYMDFLSEYPTVNALMNNQELLLAEKTTVEDNTERVKELAGMTASDVLAFLHNPVNWTELRSFVKVKLDHDRVPLRSDYGPDGKNVGIPFVTSSKPVWYTLADVLASILLNDKAPKILEAIKLVPTIEHYPTNKREIFGYEIDLEKQDFFQSLIEIRASIKEEIKAKDKIRETHELEDNQQLALKLISNATSYGSLVEITQDEACTEPQKVFYYDVNGQEKQTSISRVETPGKYFAGPIGSLIPASGRLLLAIAQRLSNDVGLSHVMMDTDSIAIARPDNITREEFRMKALYVGEWFQAISPYKNNKNVLEVEDVNYSISEKNILETLYFIGVSTKRYVLYNRLENGGYRIRKFSSHGLGGMMKPYDDSENPYSLPLPHENTHKMGGSKWVYDLWYQFIATIEQHKDVRTFLKSINEPTYRRVSVTTWKLHEQFRGIGDLRPFSFFCVLPSGRSAIDDLVRSTHDDGSENEHEMKRSHMKVINSFGDKPFYAPYTEKPEKLYSVRSSSTNELVPEWYGLVTVTESLRGYFDHPENKALNGRDIGKLLPFDCEIEKISYVGKEINNVALETAEETDGTIDNPHDPYTYASEIVLSSYHIADLVLLTGLTAMGLGKIKSGKVTPKQETEKSLLDAIKILHDNPIKWREKDNMYLSTLLDVPVETVKLMKYGKHQFTNVQRQTLLELV